MPEQQLREQAMALGLSAVCDIIIVYHIHAILNHHGNMFVTYNCYSRYAHFVCLHGTSSPYIHCVAMNAWQIYTLRWDLLGWFLKTWQTERQTERQINTLFSLVNERLTAQFIDSEDAFGVKMPKEDSAISLANRVVQRIGGFVKAVEEVQ